MGARALQNTKTEIQKQFQRWQLTTVKTVKTLLQNSALLKMRYDFGYQPARFSIILRPYFPNKP